MKADVLNPFPAISICTKYKSGDEILRSFPFNLCDEKLQPVYREMKGWNVNLDNCTKVSDLPDALAGYIRFIEDEVGLPVDIVSIGPDRLQTLQR